MKPSKNSPKIIGQLRGECRRDGDMEVWSMHFGVGGSEIGGGDVGKVGEVTKLIFSE